MRVQARLFIVNTLVQPVRERSNSENQQFGIGFEVDGDKVDVVLYADDLVLIAMRDDLQIL